MVSFFFFFFSSFAKKCAVLRFVSQRYVGIVHIDKTRKSVLLFFFVLFWWFLFNLETSSVLVIGNANQSINQLIILITTWLSNLQGLAVESIESALLQGFTGSVWLEALISYTDVCVFLFSHENYENLL